LAQSTVVKSQNMMDSKIIAGTRNAERHRSITFALVTGLSFRHMKMNDQSRSPHEHGAVDGQMVENGYNQAKADILAALATQGRKKT